MLVVVFGNYDGNRYGSRRRKVGVCLCMCKVVPASSQGPLSWGYHKWCVEHGRWLIRGVVAHCLCV